MPPDLPESFRPFWGRFLAACDDPAQADARYYEAYRIGSEASHADAGAALVLDGTKTATSSLLWSYEAEGRPPPTEGALSILMDGRDAPVCVVESVRFEVVPIGEVTADFAREYGEADRTLPGWHAAFRPWYAEECASLGRTFDDMTPLLCEWFRIVYREDAG